MKFRPLRQMFDVLRITYKLRETLSVEGETFNVKDETASFCNWDVKKPPGRGVEERICASFDRSRRHNWWRALELRISRG